MVGVACSITRVYQRWMRDCSASATYTHTPAPRTVFTIFKWRYRISMSRAYVPLVDLDFTSHRQSDSELAQVTTCHFISLLYYKASRSPWTVKLSKPNIDQSITPKDVAKNGRLASHTLKRAIYPSSTKDVGNLTGHRSHTT